jgi:hypothetical protein
MAAMNNTTIHITFLDVDGKVIEYHKIDPSVMLSIPVGATSIMVNATFSEVANVYR